MRIQSQAKTAICALMILNGAGKNELLPVRVVGERIGISLSYLEVVFNKLKKGGLISSTLGPKGGYSLTCQLDAVSVGEVIELVDGPINDSGLETELGHELWAAVDSLVLGWLKEVSIAQLLTRKV